MIKILFIFFTITSLFSSEYSYRKLKSPPIKLDHEINIHIATPPRTGSTLVFNIVNYLFEDKNFRWHKGRVTKNHVNPFTKDAMLNLDKPNTIIITTIRDPMNIIASLHLLDGKSLNDISIKQTLKKFACYFWDLKLAKTYKKASIIILKYENFQNNQFEYIFDQFETKLDITIPKEEKEKIVKYFCIESMQKIAEQYVDFSSWDDYTGIHGMHINHSLWNELFTYEQAKSIYSKTYNLRKNWGYPGPIQ